MTIADSRGPSTSVPKMVSAEEIPGLIPTGASIAADGFGMMGVADEVYAAIQRSFHESGEPTDLTLFHTSGQSNEESGISRFAAPGLLAAIVGGHWRRTVAPGMRGLIKDNEVAGVCLPQGQIAELYRARAAGRPGNLTQIGLGTFVDPRWTGGRINERAMSRFDADKFVTVVEIEGEEYLMYKTFDLDVGIIRGTEVDAHGNISQSEEAAGLDSLALAQATKNSGGVVIAQVLREHANGYIAPREVAVPGALIDYVLVTTDPDTYHRQNTGWTFHPQLTAHATAPGEADFRPMVAENRLRIGRNAVKILSGGEIINVGTGIPGDAIPPALKEASLTGDVTLTLESGVFGGQALGGVNFGAAFSPGAIIDQASQFAFYAGGGLDAAFMGVGELSPTGQVNVAGFGGDFVGAGGFLDITTNARQVCFLASVSKIERKLREEVEHVCYDGQVALRAGRAVFLVTEHHTYRLEESGWRVAQTHTDSDEAVLLPEAWLADGGSRPTSQDPRRTRT